MRAVSENLLPFKYKEFFVFEWEVESALTESEEEWFHYDIRDAIKEDIRTKQR